PHSLPSVHRGNLRRRRTAGRRDRAGPSDPLPPSRERAGPGPGRHRLTPNPVTAAERDSRSSAILAISVATALWGMAGLFVKSASISALWFATYRLWTGVVVYAVILVVTRGRFRLATIRACALGGVLFAADQAFAFSAFKLTTVANANIIIALAPIFIAFAASRLFGERIGRREVLLAGV